jgi:hypothetical protein
MGRLSDAGAEGTCGASSERRGADALPEEDRERRGGTSGPSQALASPVPRWSAG